MKSYTDLNQSKKLTEILPMESADMWYWKSPTTGFVPEHPMFHKSEHLLNIPCWGLAALLDVLPKGINISTPKPTNELSYCCWNQYDEIYASNPVDACYEMILKLREQKLL